MTTDLILKRTVAAPREKVWEAWTNPEYLKQWYMPRPGYFKSIDLDLKPGGKFDMVMVWEGNEMPYEGCVLEVIEGEKIAFTDALSEGYKPTTKPFFAAIITLEDAPDGGTTYTAMARHKDEATATQHDEMGFQDGWGTCVTQLDGLAQCLVKHPLGERDIILTRWLPASPAAIWALYKTQEKIQTWWGPKGFRCVTKSFDFREGGAWMFDMIGPDGKVWVNSHSYRHLVPEKEIAFIMGGTTEDTPKDVTIDFQAEGDGTRVTQVMSFKTKAERDEVVGWGAVELGYQTLDKLRDML
jgi:uncharacterized protein YndB with AHSA1/START domain